MDEIAGFNPIVGQVEQLEPGVRRILAPNPSPMTFRGTNTYLLGKGAVTVIDPGPAYNAHLQAIMRALGPDEQITHILVTHSHLDHSPLAPALAQATGAKVYAFGDSKAGQRAALAQLTGLGGGEGVDKGFAPDITLADGETLSVGDIDVTAIWTPGHMANHLCFATQDIVFTGDHVMGWATSMVSPPDGDLTAFMESLEKLKGRSDRVFFPAHGAPVITPAKRIESLIAHRRGREAQILKALEHGPATANDLAARIYTDTPKALLPAASRNVLAHLIDLTERNLTKPTETLRADGQFSKL
ncbi:MBL fold metallo-hydrolase [Actibacterium lipolyticum]|uniref:Putative polyketide biosynthesis zinc-dependent hydrolase BaeB n=1 Tax=Actibacterium lipolyticum TaxID=1524263 RepID=A0A238JVG3_9RHOB|nr:MBL fold metallo-hydrolase [Actibacterium lipolyticum]SMX34640.1 putative polyketide biosynthesis zinc-dependent hydrolase BaeB [Actibacterium lipolyticum]